MAFVNQAAVLAATRSPQNASNPTILMTDYILDAGTDQRGPLIEMFVKRPHGDQDASHVQVGHALYGSSRHARQLAIR